MHTYHGTVKMSCTSARPTMSKEGLPKSAKVQQHALLTISDTKFSLKNECDSFTGQKKVSAFRLVDMVKIKKERTNQLSEIKKFQGPCEISPS